MLEAGAEQDAVVAGDDVFGAITVVNVEIDNGNSTQPRIFQRMVAGDGHIVEQTESRRISSSGVVSRRANGAEGAPTWLCHDPVDGGDAAASRTARSVGDLNVLSGKLRESVAGFKLADEAQQPASNDISIA